MAPVRIGVLTGGGDCPGLNAAIRAIVRRGIDHHGHELLGFQDGWRGPLEGAHRALTLESIRGILPRGGTILGTSRTNPFGRDGGVEAVSATLADLGVDGLIAIGGEDTLGAAARLHDEAGVPVVGVPKTIDNDLGATDRTFGFDTAVHVATEAIDRLHTTAESHNRILVVEVMGRHAGWIALHAGLAGGADAILVPERPFDVGEVCRLIERRHGRGRSFSIVVVAEGAVPSAGTMDAVAAGRAEGAGPIGEERSPIGEERSPIVDRASTGPLHRASTGPVRRAEHRRETLPDEFGHERLGGIASVLGPEIERRTGFETRVTVLGHVQRGGTPTAFDRVLATQLGVAAIDAAHDRRWGTMAALRGTRVELAPLRDAVVELRTVPDEDYAVAESFFG